jgi:hypothetical protein
MVPASITQGLTDFKKSGRQNFFTGLFRTSDTDTCTVQGKDSKLYEATGRIIVLYWKALESNCHSASQEIPHLIWNPKVHYRVQRAHQRPCVKFRNNFFQGKELLAPRPNSKLEDDPLSAVRDSSFNTFAATFYI